MHRFNLFVKSNKIRWTNNKVIYGVMAILFTVVGLDLYVFKTESAALNKTLMLSLVATFFAASLLKIIGLVKLERLHGHFNGFLEFRLKEIKIDKITISLQEIKTLQITNEDYYGKLKNYGKGNFNFARSNGVDNIIEITLLNGAKSSYNYELYNSNDLLKVKSFLIYYCKMGKLSFSNLSNLLGINKEKEIAELRIELQNFDSTSANRR